MTFNLQSIVAQSSKHVNASYESTKLAADTAAKAWTLSSAKNAELAKQQQEAALAALFD